ncbi:MAG: DNA methyltransferase, partial [Brachymonas sp.]|nr:DNA methyltransferase [Brachymonas sp.]
ARSMAQALLASEKAADVSGRVLPEAISKLAGKELAQFRSAYVGAMQAAAAESHGTARILKEELAANFAKLTREEIDQYERKIQRAMQAGDKAARLAAQAIAAIGEQAAKSLGIDMELHTQRMSAGFEQARASLGVMLRDLVSIVPLGGYVLDPFMGCASTGMACVETGRRFTGIELTQHYYEASVRRLAEAVARHKHP